MQPHSSTTPFGRRSLTLAHVASQMVAKARPPDKAVHKWQMFRAICTAQAQARRIRTRARRSRRFAELPSRDDAERRGRTDRIPIKPAAGVCGRTAWPPSTLRRHLAVLVDAASSFAATARTASASPAKGREGRIEMAFGFDLSPLVARAEEFEAWAEEVRRRGTRAPTSAGADYALPARHRQDDCDGDRRGRSNPQGRAGASRLGGGP